MQPVHCKKVDKTVFPLLLYHCFIVSNNFSGTLWGHLRNPGVPQNLGWETFYINTFPSNWEISVGAGWLSFTLQQFQYLLCFWQYKALILDRGTLLIPWSNSGTLKSKMRKSHWYIASNLDCIQRLPPSSFLWLAQLSYCTGWIRHQEQHWQQWQCLDSWTSLASWWLTRHRLHLNLEI